MMTWYENNSCGMTVDVRRGLTVRKQHKRNLTKYDNYWTKQHTFYLLTHNSLSVITYFPYFSKAVLIEPGFNVGRTTSHFLESHQTHLHAFLTIRRTKQTWQPTPTKKCRMAVGIIRIYINYLFRLGDEQHNYLVTMKKMYSAYTIGWLVIMIDWQSYDLFIT